MNSRTRISFFLAGGYLDNVQFQKISIPTAWKVNGNSEGVGALESQNFKRNALGLTGISRGVADSNQKPSRGRGMDISGTIQYKIMTTLKTPLKLKLGSLRSEMRWF